MNRIVRWALAPLVAAAALLFAGQAAAACPYTGNTSNTDSAAMLSALNDICAGGVSGSAAPFTLTGGPSNLTVGTGGSDRVALPGTDTSVWLINTGTVALNYKLGNASVTTATTDSYLAAGACALVAKNSNADVGAIVASGSGSLQVLTGTGTPLGCGGGSGGGQVAGYATSLALSVTRPANATAYAANDAWSDSTSAPTVGGFTLSNACRTSGGHGILTSVTVVDSVDPATPLQGEVWVFDSAVTEINDNAAFAMSDSDMLKLVAGGIVPFTLASNVGAATSGTSTIYTQGNLGVGYACSGTANLRVILKVKNAYTPASGEVLSVRFNAIQTD